MDPKYHNAKGKLPSEKQECEFTMQQLSIGTAHERALPPQQTQGSFPHIYQKPRYSARPISHGNMFTGLYPGGTQTPKADKQRTLETQVPAASSSEIAQVRWLSGHDAKLIYMPTVGKGIATAVGKDSLIWQDLG